VVSTYTVKLNKLKQMFLKLAVAYWEPAQQSLVIYSTMIQL